MTRSLARPDFSRCPAHCRIAGCSTALHRAGDDLVAHRVGFERRQQRRVVTLRAAAGEDDFVVELRAEQRLHLPARRLDGAADLRAEGVDGRRVAELLGEEWQHGRHHARIDAGCGVVVEINGLGHGVSALCLVALS
jgi:hypothetical protein